MALESPISTRTVLRRTRRDPKPRFKLDRRRQLDGVSGCPELLLDGAHPAREVQRFVENLDLSAIEAEYSSLGRHGHHPRSVLAVWLYASQIGIHHATKVARACATDAALRFLSGGHAIAAGTLKRFRQRRGDLLRALLAETVKQAYAAGLILVEELATDSMRLRAHASPQQTGTKKRSAMRIEQLALIDRASLSGKRLEKHDKQTARHRAIVAKCDAEERTNVVLTNDMASLMKFPNGAAHPGHRVTATAAGVSERIVVSVLVDADTTDDGKLESALRDTKRVLQQAGVPVEGMRATADAGYFCETDLSFASKNRDWVDVLIAEGAAAAPVDEDRKYFHRRHFRILDDNTAICPANKPMTKPHTIVATGRMVWHGRGCPQCKLQPQCTKNKRRSLSIDPRLEGVRTEMRDRFKEPDAGAQYKKRIATIEPVFSNIEDNMNFRRSSSRFSPTILSEVLLNVVAHNLSRITAARKLACINVTLEVD